LIEQGFDAVNLDGGMMAWHDAGIEMVTESGEPTVA
jgi:rhodanese-related sulfurtransferase